MADELLAFMEKHGPGIVLARGVVAIEVRRAGTDVRHHEVYRGGDEEEVGVALFH